MFDFNSVLRAEPGNTQALCGRALLHLALDQQKVPAPPPHLELCRRGALRGGILLSTPEDTSSRAGPAEGETSKPRLHWGSHPGFRGVLACHLESPCFPVQVRVDRRASLRLLGAIP